MAVYVDSLFDTSWANPRLWPHRHSCHMIADTDAELHAMATTLGISRDWARTPGPGLHYDLYPATRAMAVRCGAVEISARELSRKILTRIRAHKEHPSCR